MVILLLFLFFESVVQPIVYDQLLANYKYLKMLFRFILTSMIIQVVNNRGGIGQEQNNAEKTTIWNNLFKL